MKYLKAMKQTIIFEFYAKITKWLLFEEKVKKKSLKFL